MTQRTISWSGEVEKRREELLKHTQAFLQIKSVLDPQTAQAGAPFGEGVAAALDYVLQLCEAAGMKTANVEGYAAHAEFGQGEELVGVLSHVDVVPEGDGWTTPPYAAEIVDGKIVARGVLDDKGPTMAAVFAAKIVKELGLPLKRRVRLIFGTDEETNWRCVKRYFETEEMPTYGFSPDADFPLIYAEKGLTHLVWRQTLEAYERLDGRSGEGTTKTDSEVDAILHSLEGGLRMNMVPDRSRAVLQPGLQSAEALAEQYRTYLQQHGLTGDAEVEADHLTLTLQGVSVHGMDPGKGVNAATELIHFLAGLNLDERAMRFARFVDSYLYRQHGAEALGLAHDDPEMGPLTMNVGIIRYASDGEIEYHINIRYPHSHPYERWQPVLLKHLEREAMTQEVEDHMLPHRVEPSSPLVGTLQRIYTEQTGEEAYLIAIGGATYARSLDQGVAFGPLFPGRADSAHQRDEHLYIDDLLKATALYAQAIYELANL
ncbi:dipeptidase PepV [Brevibacillus humidisoli]|uniref:dipeptidase PepV n=1 Tax=Brevibacillus humidisoli TaxID=2895522 RepID=UPI001E3710E4|nr:dipeptidase PepV [Brevibacillus humidisoli]UFJ39411.1 dipeptidase PepV [Brevibacillus humidisoli]